jgi:hypothetical protein
MRNRRKHYLEPSQEHLSKEPQEILSSPLSIKAYLIWIAFWALMLYFDYTDIFASYFLFEPVMMIDEGVYISLMWLLIAGVASLASVPWRYHRKPLGLLGEAFALLVVCLKFVPLLFP